MNEDVSHQVSGLDENNGSPEGTFLHSVFTLDSDTLKNDLGSTLLSEE